MLFPVYDESGELVDDSSAAKDASDDSFASWQVYWRSLFPQVTVEDISKFEEQYRFSEEERKDVIESFERNKGEMEEVLNEVMCCSESDLPRFEKIIRKAMKSGITPRR